MNPPDKGILMPLYEIETDLHIMIGWADTQEDAMALARALWDQRPVELLGAAQ